MTSRHSKHSDWDKVWEKVQKWDLYWLLDYIKSHDINRCLDEQGNTLVHHAVCDENLDAIACLFYFFIDPNIKNAAGQTALQLAQDTNRRCLRHFHKYHFCIDFDKASSEPNGLDALFAAIYRGDTMLGDTSGVKNNGNEGNAGGWTALHCAVMYDRSHLIRALHQRFPKLNMNLFNRSNCSALRLAVMRGHSNCIIALCKCFPAIKADSALQVACEYNRSACIPTLRKYFPQLTGNELADNYIYPSALMRAALHNSPECIRALHSFFPDIDPDLQDSSGNTVLIAAAQHSKSPNCISALSECFPNIDPNKQDNNGDTALMHACKPGFSQSITSFATYLIVRHFLDTFPNVDANIHNAQGKTALTLAIERGKAPIVDLLLERFPDIISLTNSAGQTALMLTTKKNNTKLISMLLKHIAQMQ